MVLSGATCSPKRLKNGVESIFCLNNNKKFDFIAIAGQKHSLVPGRNCGRFDSACWIAMVMAKAGALP
jgi:hypothetical protein